jgi:hypothetical protein
MLYAKIKDNTVLEFPYTWERFLTENPNIVLDGNLGLADIYATTKSALDGSSIVQVSTLPVPTDIDWSSQMAEIDKIPTFVSNAPSVGGFWQLMWNVRSKTLKELDETNTVNFTNIIDNTGITQT